jgi:cytochrome c oxidase subunit 4
MNDHATQHQPVPLSTHVMIWLGLLLLTALTVTAASLHFGGWSVFAAIAIATVKASLVLWYFMNLKYEDRLFKTMLFLALFTLTVIMVLTFFDVLLR